VPVVIIITIISGLVIILMMNDKPNNINNPIPHFQRNHKILQSFSEPIDISIDRENVVMVKDDIIPVSTTVNTDTNTKITTLGGVGDVKDIMSVIKVQAEVGRKVDLKIQEVKQMEIERVGKLRILAEDVEEKKRKVDLRIQEVKQMEIERVGKLRILAGDVEEKKRKVDLRIQEVKQMEIERAEKLRILAEDAGEKKRKVDLRIQEVKQMEIEREENARILTEEIEEKKRKVDLKIQEVKRLTEEAKKDKDDRAAAFRAKMAKYKDDKVDKIEEAAIVRGDLIDENDGLIEEEKYARALEIALKKKAVRLQAEAEMKRKLDIQRKLNEKLSESERVAMEEAAIVRGGLIDENDRLIEEAASKQRELDDAKRVASQDAYDEEYNTLMGENRVMEIAQEERMAAIEINSAKVIADAQDALSDAEEEQNVMDQAIVDQFEDMHSEVERLQAIAADAQAVYQNNIRIEAIRVREEQAAHAQFLVNTFNETRRAFTGMQNRRVDNVGIDPSNVPENLRGKILINATNGWPVTGENRDDYKLARVDEDSIDACRETCDKFYRCEGFSHERRTNKCHLFSSNAEQLEQVMGGFDMYYKSWTNLSVDDYAKYLTKRDSDRTMRERQKYFDELKAADAEAKVERSRVAKERQLAIQAAQDERKAKDEQQREEDAVKRKELRDEDSRVRLKALEDDRRSRCGPTQIIGYETDGNKCSGSECCANSGSIHGRCGTSSAHCDNRQFWSDYYKYNGPDHGKPVPAPPPPVVYPRWVWDEKRQDYISKIETTPPPSNITYNKLENTRIGVPTVYRNPGSVGKTSINASDGTFVTINSRVVHKLTEVDEGSVDACMERCNKFDRCGGFVHERSTNKCFLKSNHAKKIQDTGVDGYDMYYKIDLEAERAKAEWQRRFLAAMAG